MKIFTETICFEINLFVSDTLDFKQFPASAPVKRLEASYGFWGGLNLVHTQADPFLFVHGERLYLFYEVASYKLGRGVIAMISTDDLKHWTKPIIVLAEPYHLSYPLVFEHDGAIYMMPETGDASQIRLYRAIDDSLTKFEHVKTTMTGRWLDSVLLQRDGLYYLFTTSEDEYRKYVLHLFYSDTIGGPYTEHPMSPICSDTEYSRCGGKILEIDGKVCRVSQDCSTDYGDNVSLIAIDTLTTDEYHESVSLRNVFDRNSDVFKDGGHHLTVAKFRGKYVIATDRKTPRMALRNIYALIRRIWK